MKHYPHFFSVGVLLFLFSFASIAEFNPSTLSTNFRWRKEMILIIASFRFSMGDHVYNNAIVGKDGWLFYTGNDSIGNYQNTVHFDRKKLRFLQKELDLLNSDLKSQGITLLVVVPPEKSTVYPQKMPDEIPVIGKFSRLDQFADYMEAHGETAIVDLRPALIQASQFDNVYFKTDSHWNDLGAYIAYREIMNHLSRVYPELMPHPLSDFRYLSRGPITRDISRLIGLQSYEEETFNLVPNFEVQTTKNVIPLANGQFLYSSSNPEEQSPKLLIFHDSFYNYLAHFLEPHFSQIIAVPYTPSGTVSLLDWFQYESPDFADWIQQEAPDIVVIEIVERNLDGLPAFLGD